MKRQELTRLCADATNPLWESGMGNRARLAIAGAALSAATILSGCIQVAAPDKPIVIELNINIQQEVVYRLAEDAGNTIEENADIF